MFGAIIGSFETPFLGTGRPVNFVTAVKFVTCHKNAQGQAIFTFKSMASFNSKVYIYDLT